MTTSQIPGADLSYTDLLKATSADPVREAWNQLGNVADALGVSSMTPNGMAARSATIGELIERIAAILPERVRIEDVMASTAKVTERSRSTTYEVRELTGNGKWALAGNYDDEDEALGVRSKMVESGEIAIVVRVHSVTEREAIDRAGWR